MLDPLNSQTLAAKIYNKGFMPDELWLAFANEMSPATGAYDVQENQNLVNQSGNLLPPIEPGEIEILTVVNSHTARGVRIAYYCGTHKIKAIDDPSVEAFCEGGHFSQHKIFAKCPSIPKAITEGLEFS